MNIVLILQTKYPNAHWFLQGEDYEGLTWYDKTVKPTKATLEGLWAEVQTIIADAQTAKDAQRKTILDRLGLTEAEVQLLLG